MNILDELGLVPAGIGPGYPNADKIHTKLRRLDAWDGHSRPKQE